MPHLSHDRCSSQWRMFQIRAYCNFFSFNLFTVLLLVGSHIFHIHRFLDIFFLHNSSLFFCFQFNFILQLLSSHGRSEVFKIFILFLFLINFRPVFLSSYLCDFLSQTSRPFLHLFCLPGIIIYPRQKP